MLFLRSRLILPLVAWSLLFGYWQLLPPAQAEKSSEQLGPALEKQLNDFLELENRIEAIQKSLETTPSRLERRKLTAELNRLHTEQEELLIELEQLMGESHPRLRSRRPIPLEQDLHRQQRHRDAILENNAQR